MFDPNMGVSESNKFKQATLNELSDQMASYTYWISVLRCGQRQMCEDYEITDFNTFAKHLCSTHSEDELARWHISKPLLEIGLDPNITADS